MRYFRCATCVCRSGLLLCSFFALLPGCCNAVLLMWPTSRCVSSVYREHNPEVPPLPPHLARIEQDHPGRVQVHLQSYSMSCAGLTVLCLTLRTVSPCNLSRT